MRPGARVSEVDLANELGFSRTPVREAMTILESEGLLEHKPGEGVTVMLLGRHELEEAFELREVLECGAVTLAADRLTPDELRELDEILKRYEQLAREVCDGEGLAPDDARSTQMAVLDMAFHMKVISGTRNRRLLKMVSDVHLLTRTLGRWTSLPSVPHMTRLAMIIRSHRRIYRALVQRDKEAAEHWMRDHIVRSRVYHLAAFDWNEQRLQAESVRKPESFPQSIIQLLDQMESGEI